MNNIHGVFVMLILNKTVISKSISLHEIYQLYDAMIHPICNICSILFAKFPSIFTKDHLSSNGKIFKTQVSVDNQSYEPKEDGPIFIILYNNCFISSFHICAEVHVLQPQRILSKSGRISD